jgi:hypothetical protein
VRQNPPGPYVSGGEVGGRIYKNRPFEICFDSVLHTNWCKMSSSPTNVAIIDASIVKTVKDKFKCHIRIQEKLMKKKLNKQQKLIVLRRVVAKTEKAIARKKLSKSSKNKKCGKKSSRFRKPKSLLKICLSVLHYRRVKEDDN